ncbi:unnamed protein product [Paramecium pentaurelia]|uniref:AAA+ ATPase domain-containing protein n=1 Tax=Paramecium pentaurelia TaxID=43138 RepID=A0A8S1XIX1_9CILI|nr:unnamed protein product [Paramecium pentaurelia]
MNQIFQSQKILDFRLQDTIAIFLSQHQQNQSVIIYDFNRNVFKEYLILNFQVSKVISDPNMQYLLLFEEKKENQRTLMHMAKLEKSYAPISTIMLPSIKIQLIEWCNSNICAIVFQNDLILFNIYSQTILKKLESNFNQILQFKVNQKFDTILQQYQASISDPQICYVMPLEDITQQKKFENCIACTEIMENEEHLIMITTNNNMLKLIIANFDKDIKIKHEIIQNGIQIVKNSSFLQIKYRKQKQELLLIDSTKKLQLFNLDNSYQMIETKSYQDVSSFVLSLQNQHLIYMDKNMCLYQEGIKVEELNNLQRAQMEISIASQVKKSAIQGILSDKNKSGTLKEIINQYSTNFEKFKPKFSEMINLRSSYKNFPLIEFRVLIYPTQDIENYIKYVPDMSEYVETQSVKKHIKQFEIALKGDNPLLCEGDAACGKTSVIQYLAYKHKQPLLIMNLNSFTQISDLIGKIEILPGFKLEFQPGPFARAVQEGMWILLDEANLASDSILRVIEDVLELGYLTIFGNSINSHNDLIDGTLTIRKHQNFKLFLTQNPATDLNFAGSRHVFTPSLMSQFIQLSFKPMSENDMENIIGQIISKKLQNSLSPEKQLKLITLIMKIYLEIKQNKLDDGLFTLRDILQIVDAVSLEPNYKNIFDVDILPIKYCLQLIITQFLDTNKNLDMINSLIDEFNFIGYSNKAYEETEDKRIGQLVIWNQQQQELYLSFHNFLFAMLTLCYRTKRAALVVGQQFCGKLFSVKLWLKLQGIKNYEVFELSEDTTSEDLFGKYQPSEKGFQFCEGPITRCFSQGKVLILLDIDAPESALTESLNGILEKKFLQLIVQNKKYERHKDFHIIAISSDQSKIAHKFTPALKSRFLSTIVKFQVKLQDICQLFRQANLPGDQEFVHTITQQLGLDISQKEPVISFKYIIRFLQPIKQFIQFVTQNLKQNLSKGQALKRVIDCIQFFIALSLEDNKLLYSDQIKLPLQFEDVLEGSFEDASKKFIFTPSRKRVSDIIAIAIASKVPLILQGSAGVGKTKVISMFSQTCRMFQQTEFYYINMNQNTDINDLMGQFICSIKNGQKEFKFEKGLLFSAMEKGGIALVDEVNLAQSSVLNFLASIAKYPTEFVDPVSNIKIKINEKFRILFAQNPPHYVGRSELPLKLASKVILVEVPNYTLKEVLQICQGTSNSVKQGMEYFLTKIIPYPEDGDEKKLKYNNTQFTLRQFIKFRNRLEKTKLEITTQKEIWENLLRLHQIILFPKDNYEQNQLKSSIVYSEQDKTIQFEIKNDKAEIKISLEANKNLNSLSQEIQNLSDQQRLLLSQIALCFYCKENVLIEGETTFKTYVTKLFSSIIQFQNPNPFELIYTSSVTEIADLLGTTESHNSESYMIHCKNLIQKLGKNQKFINLDQIQTTLNDLAKQWGQKIFFDSINKNLNNQFPFVERGLTFSARFGGVVCLKNITLADQSVLEGLNALLEIEPHFVVNGKKIDIHKEFIVIALLNSNFGNQLSDALQSRLTKISIQTQELLNSSNQLQESYQKSIRSKISIQGQSNEIITFVEQLLGSLKKQKYEQYKMLSSRQFYQWMNFLALTINAPNLEKLSLGFQFVILDHKKENFEKLIKNESYISTFNNAEISMKKNLEKLGLFNSSKIIMNPITNKIIQRIFSAFSVDFIPCLIGPPGIGKSAIAQEVAQILGKEFQRVCCSDSLSVDDLFGSYAPTFDEGSAGFTFQEGYLAMALKKKSLILFDEINLASPEVLSTLQALFNMDEKSLSFKDYNINKTGCVFLCSMNPPSYQGRQELPQCIQNLLCDIHLQQFSIEEVLDIFKQSYNKQIKNLKDFDIDFSVIIDLHKELSQQQDKNQSSNYDFNIRFLQNLLQLFSDQFIKQIQLIKDQQLKTELIILCLEIIYVEHYYQTDFSETILIAILNKYKISLEQWNNRKVFLEQKADMIYINRLVDDDSKQILKFPLIRLAPPQMINNSYTINLQNSKIFEKILIALQSQKIILCQGDTSTGKTSSIITLASMLNQRFILLPINCDLEADDLLGNFAIVQDNYDEVQQELQKLISKQNVVIQSKNSQKSEINMKYMEGVLKICLKNGYWLILDNINLARPEIIERLNSLGEDSPCLFINEFGDKNRKIIPHKQFRLICIQNPSRAESHQLSPAFYNRCLKVNFKIDITENTQDIIEILVKNGEGCCLFQEETVKLAEKFLNQIKFMKNHLNFKFSFRQVQKAFKMIQDEGYNNYESVMEIVFGQNFLQCSQDTLFPIFDVNSYVNPDSILNKLVSNSIQLFDSGIINQILQFQNLYEFLKKYLGEKEFQTYKYFLDTISKKINLMNFPTQNQFNTGSYELSLSGQIDYCLCGINMVIEPLFLSLTFRNKEVQTLQMKIQCQFLSQIFQAEARLNQNKKFEVIFTKTNENSIAQMIEQLIGSQYMQLFASFNQMLEEALYE